MQEPDSTNGESRSPIPEGDRFSLSEEPKNLWALEKADTFIGDIALALWLAIASIWRGPLVLLKRDSISRLDNIIALRRILPPRLNLFMAAIVSALFMSFVLPKRIPHSSLSETIEALNSTSSEKWIIVAAPALISLWVVVALLSSIFRFAVGRQSRDPQAYIAETISSVTIIICISLVTIIVLEPWMETIGVVGIFTYVVELLTMITAAYLLYAGWNCATQISGCLNSSLYRAFVVIFIGPIGFVIAAIAAMVGIYWIVTAQATVFDALSKIGRPQSGIAVRSSTCFVAKENLICQGLMTIDSDAAVGATKYVEIGWRDPRRSDDFEAIALAPSSQTLVLTPNVHLGAYWTFRSKEPSPISLQIDKSDVCSFYSTLETHRRDQPPQIELSITVAWYPGYALASRENPELSYPRADFTVQNIKADLDKLCT
jgi:hypothetical protein